MRVQSSICRELVEPPACARNALKKLDIDLEPMARLRLFVARPPVRMSAVFLVRRQTIHAVVTQDARTVAQAIDRL